MLHQLILGHSTNKNLVSRDNSQVMTYLPGPGYFEYYKQIFGGICSGANVLLVGQQWSVEVYCIYFTTKKSLDYPRFYKNLMSITSLSAGASVNTKFALGFGAILYAVPGSCTTPFNIINAAAVVVERSKVNATVFPSPLSV